MFAADTLYRIQAKPTLSTCIRLRKAHVRNIFRMSCRVLASRNCGFSCGANALSSKKNGITSVYLILPLTENLNSRGIEKQPRESMRDHHVACASFTSFVQKGKDRALQGNFWNVVHLVLIVAGYRPCLPRSQLAPLKNPGSSHRL